MDDQQIMDNISTFSALEIAEFIRKGYVSFDQLTSLHDFSYRTREEVKRLLRENDAEEVDDNNWEKARSLNTIESYTEYLQNNVTGKHRDEARQAKERLSIPSRPTRNSSSRDRYRDTSIERLKRDIEGEFDRDRIVEIISSYLTKNPNRLDDFYEEIRINKNFLSASVIDNLERKEVIDFKDLEEKSNINEKFLEYIVNESLEDNVIDVDLKEIESIEPKRTEIYLWGIPSSGKTCALGAILNEATHGEIINFAEPRICQGYEYMMRLTQLFNGVDKVFRLPEGTPTDAIFDMSYVLKKDGKDYPVTFIDLSGETIDSMYRSNASLTLSPQKEKGLELATKLLTGNKGINRKIHFFVLEYGGHEKTYKGINQYNLLTGALAYIKKTGIFNRETDAIYLLVTKSDMAGEGKKRSENVKQYIQEYYFTFYEGLKSICKENEINEGEVDIIPFSIGEVCFQNLTLYNNKSSLTVVKHIINRAKGFKSGKLANILDKVKK